MSATITWYIVELERRIADGIVLSARWHAGGVEEYEGKSYYYYATGISSFNEPPEDYEVIPYENLSENEVLDWVWSQDLSPEDKEKIEEDIQARIDELKFPVLGYGTPWEITLPDPPDNVP
tara:strand:+ start:763 stop:1125 length:363 start_codon:yes stop_codon:yes gene_type:complete